MHKRNSTKILISLATPRNDNVKNHTNGVIINALLKQQLAGKNGNIIQNLLTDDKIHLSEKGVSILAGNIKRAIHMYTWTGADPGFGIRGT